MTILHRYIQKNILLMTCLVLLIIAGLEVFISLVNEMGSLGKGKYDALQAFYFVLLSLPHNLYPLFPVAALIACLVALGRLASQSELIVMRASGISKVQITVSVLRTTLVMLIFITLIGEVFAPTLQKKATDYKHEMTTGTPATSAKEGGWLRDGESFIYIQIVLPNGKLKGILRYQFRHDRLISAATAQSAQYINQHWEVQNVAETRLYDDHTTTHSFAQQTWPISFDPKLIGVGGIESSETGLLSLYSYIQHLQKGGLSARAYEFAFWKRLFQPLVTLVMIGLAIPFIFGPLRTATMGLRILVGVIVGFGFYTFNEFLGPFSLVYQISPLLSAALPTLLFAGVDVWLFRRAI